MKPFCGCKETSKLVLTNVETEIRGVQKQPGPLKTIYTQEIIVAPD